jgi:hypothetical protein
MKTKLKLNKKEIFLDYKSRINNNLNLKLLIFSSKMCNILKSIL